MLEDVTLLTLDMLSIKVLGGLLISDGRVKAAVKVGYDRR